jgi:hypothetical protein
LTTENDQLITPDSGVNKFEWVPSPRGTFETYSNYTHTSWSLFDVRVTFGQIRPEVGDSPRFVVEERAAITVSWAHAKQLLLGLSALIESYEKTNGEIKPLKLTPRPE